MRCPVQNENADLLLGFCARGLSPELTAIVEQHILVCEECRSFADGQRQLWDALDAWQPERVSADFEDRLYFRIEQNRSRGFWSRLLGETFSWKPALPLAAAFATVVISVMLVTPASSPDPGSLQQSGRIESLEPEQVERTLEDIEMLKQLTPPQNSGPARAL